MGKINNGSKKENKSIKKKAKTVLIKKNRLKTKTNSKNLNLTYYLKKIEISLAKSLNDKYLENFIINFNCIHYLNCFKKIIRNKRKKKKDMPVLKKYSNIKNLKTIILDWDETLIHSNFNKLGTRYELMNNGEKIILYWNIRPYLYIFLNKLFKKYELILFTSSVKNYADFILNIIDPEDKYFSYKFYRNDCIKVYENYYVKDISFINRNMNNIILIDNSAFSFGNFLKNSIPILSFNGDKNDIEFKNLVIFINKIFKHNSVRPILNNYFKFKKYITYTNYYDCFVSLYS